MPFRCPYCSHSMSPKAPKPGRYTPKCPKCQGAFLLEIPADPEAQPRVSAIAGQGPAAVTQAPATKAVLPTGGGGGSSAEATGVFESGAPASSARKTVLPTRPSAAPPSGTEATGVFETGAAAAPAEATGVFGAAPEVPAGDATMAPEVSEPSRGSIRAGGKTAVPRPGGAAKTRVDAPEGGATVAGTMPPSFDLDADDRAAGKRVDGTPDQLGGYRVVKELGRGGMGAVYLARQISLDRPVALKVMNPRWAKDAVFVARFIREAYAAAQLVHHNVVQIYDIGLQDEVNFFSMEFVEGRSLADLIKKDGKLDPELAVGYTLQAARGLKFAHDRGMIHRDIKPDNLMLNTHGVVKVADLGLVKTPAMSAADDELKGVPAESRSASLSASLGSEITNANVAMGTPAYMSPEQCRDAATVDARADIYSLGCTLYVLLTGKPPFSGSTAMEVMTKHTQEAMVPPDQIVKWVPKEVSGILLKMTAKRPEDRYQTMDELIAALEQWLGVNRVGPFAPKEEHVAQLESCATRYNTAPLAGLRKRLVQGFVGGSAALAVVCLLAGMPLTAFGFVGLVSTAVATYFVAQGLGDRTYLFRRVREFAFDSSLGDLLTGAAGVLVFALVLALSGLWPYWLGFGVVGVGLAFAMRAVIDRPLSAQRRGALEDADALYRRLRVQGLEEDALRAFVAKYAGRDWEAFFEASFGYEAKMATRAEVSRLGDGALAAVKHAAWREPVFQALDALSRQRRAARERKLLQKLEQKALEAKGVDKATARDQAEAAAEAVVAGAAELRDEGATVAEEGVARKPRRSARELVEVSAAKAPKPLKPRASPAQMVLEQAFGWKLRFVAAAALIAGAFVFLRANGGDKDPLTALALGTTPEWSAVGPFGHMNAAAAGVWLLVSLGFRSWVGRVGLIAAALVTFAGHKLGVPRIGAVQSHQVAALLGAAVGVLGMALSPPPKR